MKLKSFMISEKNKRRADVGTVMGKWNVVLYENGEQVRIEECHDHSEEWAMSLAENWIRGIIKE